MAFVSIYNWPVFTALLRRAQKVRNMVKSSVKQAAIGSRLNPQNPRSPPWFEGWYTRIISPEHSFGIVTGYFPDQEPEHAGAYTGLLFNHDAAGSKLQTWESYLPTANSFSISRGEDAEPNMLGASDAPDFTFLETSQNIVRIQSEHESWQYEANIDGARLLIKSISSNQPWDDDGGSPQGLLHLIPGIGLHWYVHSTKTRVQYEFHIPTSSKEAASDSSSDNGHSGNSSGSSNGAYSNGSSNGNCTVSSSECKVLKGEGWAHLEKNWGGSFPRSFIWSQGFATVCTPDGKFDTEAQYCVAGGVLPTFNMDQLPIPLPDMLLLGYRSKTRNWHFKPQSPTLFSTTVKQEEGLLEITAKQLNKSLVLKVEANPSTFTKVAGPSRNGFVPHSVESYSAKAVVECYEYGKLVETMAFDRSALEFGGNYAKGLDGM